MALLLLLQLPHGCDDCVCADSFSGGGGFDVIFTEPPINLKTPSQGPQEQFARAGKSTATDYTSNEIA